MRVHLETTVSEVDESGRLDAFVLKFPFADLEGDLLPSRTTVQKWIADGFVTVNGLVKADKSYKLRIGDRVIIDLDIFPANETPPAEALDIPIIYQDKHILVINKPVGISSHPVPRDLTGTVVNFLYHMKIPVPVTSNPLRPGIVHRLDKNTSGLMVIASTDKAAATLIEMIKNREVTRKYIAILFGNPPLDSGVIEKPIGRHPTDRKKMAVTDIDHGRPAKTFYAVLTRYPGFSLVGCKLETGRTHQIRVHMSSLGYPVVGDPMYGGRRAPERIARFLINQSKKGMSSAVIDEVLTQIGEIVTADKVHLLHAAILSFRHPETGEQMTFRAEPNAKFSRVRQLLETLPHEETGNVL